MIYHWKYIIIFWAYILYIYTRRELQKRCKLNASIPYQIQTYIHLYFLKDNDPILQFNIGFRGNIPYRALTIHFLLTLLCTTLLFAIALALNVKEREEKKYE